jgi:hypothetical protein
MEHLVRLLQLKSVDNDGWLYAKTAVTTFIDTLNVTHKAAREQEYFKDIHTLCIFVGYPRSGHSIVGSVIDAHPNGLMAHRMDSLQYIGLGYTEPELFYMLKRNSERYAKTGRMLTGYQYNIPNQLPVSAKTLKVIGDQEGNRSSVRLGQDPHLLRRLIERKRVKVKLIHVMRNPFDNITTWALRSQSTIEFNIQRYFDRVRNVDKIKKTSALDLLDVRHEEFVENFDISCRRLFGFLDLDTEERFIRDCGSIVYSSPHKSRSKVDWSPKLISEVEARIAEFPFLSGYSFSSGGDGRPRADTGRTEREYGR